MLTFAIASSSTLYAFSLAFDEGEAKIAELTLQMSLEPSQLGAVLFGDKPVCLEGLDGQPANCIIDSTSTLMSSCYRQFLSVWNRIASEEAPFAFIPGTTDWGDIVLWVNKAAFLTVVEENLLFFQAILGPLLTPEGLLQEFLTPGVNPLKVLRFNKALFGILLGFGKDNSSFYARIEQIELPATERLSVPFRSYSFATFKFHNAPHFAVWDWTPLYSPPHPTPGYCSLEEEEALLVKTCSSSSWKHPKGKGESIPLFGCIPDSRETKQLLRRYCAAADKAKCLLASKDFLQKTLALLLGVSKIDLTITPALSNPLVDRHSMNRAVATALVRGTLEDAAAYRAGLIAGFQGLEEPSIDNPLFSYCEAEYAVLAHQNLAASDVFFGSIDSEWAEVVPQQLYYRTLKPGIGTPVSQETKTVLISYSITPIEGTSSEDHSYEDTCGRDVQHSLAELIPGMSHAIVGMRPRETREILVHPAHAYGVDSRFEPGVSLRIKVSLRSHRDITEPLSPLAKLSLTLPEIKHDPDECLWALGYAEGAAAWAHLGQAADLIDREAVIKELSAWDPGNEEDIMAFSHLQIELCRRRYGL
ncbi:MAG: hypothetical protein JSR80_02640 [Verrucomicrobia bacterium]|nr:hypothetical protein [Verrucomicrobiota bacterium]